MKVVTIATDHNHHLERLLVSARHFGIDIIQLGQGRKYQSHNDKTRWLLEYFEGLDDDEIVLYTDGYDSVFLSDLDYIEKEFLKMNHPFVMGTEQNFNCDASPLKKLDFYLTYPKGKKPYRFLNAGGYIGRVGYVRDMLKRVEKDGENDQDMLNQYYSKNHGTIQLDHDQKIFSCIAGRSGMEDKDYLLDSEGRVKNTITGSNPAILHAAGKNFYGMYKVIRQLGFFPKETFSEDEVKQYKKSRFWNGLTAYTTQDNYLFHFLLKSIVAIVVSLLIYQLIKLV
ncbi:glycosyltransferase domain-containing protein [Reichenbachiella sp.]|uniref:glycosyltransferase domain-containing protein n=1 Tax=Reichenbachiella sp. TaxID=2184521 RepID=UPI003BAFE11F